MTGNSLIPIGNQRVVNRRETTPFSFLRQEIDRLFDDVARDTPGLSTAAMPRMDVSETEKAIEIAIELPCLEKKDVELNVADNLLTIRGEKTRELKEKNVAYHLVERSYGSLSRSVELPASVRTEDITAEITKGVLRVTVPKPAPKQTKQIDIKTAA